MIYQKIPAFLVIYHAKPVPDPLNMNVRLVYLEVIFLLENAEILVYQGFIKMMQTEPVRFVLLIVLPAMEEDLIIV